MKKVNKQINNFQERDFSEYSKLQQWEIRIKFLISNPRALFLKYVYLIVNFYKKAACSYHSEGFRNMALRVFNWIFYQKETPGLKNIEELLFDDERRRENFASLEDTLKLFKSDFSVENFLTEKPIDIIIPVYNGFDYLEILFKSVFANSSLPYRLIIIDDCSSDQRIWPLLKKIKEENSNQDIELLQNEHNLGFLKTVNRAVELTQNHFLILNTDVEVPELWLERLMKPIFENKNIASTTPFTNAGTIFSFPEMPKDNEIMAGPTVNQVDLYFRHVKMGQYLEMPTGVGFCMGFNKRVVDKIGMFDEKNFGKGYCEENDWSQRAIEAGYKNVIVTNLFVYHKHGGSFDAAEKKQLQAKNLKILDKKHPKYFRMIEKFEKKDPLKSIRNFLFILVSVNNGNSKTILYFDHGLGGGSNYYTKNFISKELKEGSNFLVVMYNHEKRRYRLEYHHQSKIISYVFHDFELLHALLDYLDVDKIIVSELFSYENPLDVLSEIEKIKLEKKCELEFLVHDFFCICPNFTLINQEGVYCGIPEKESCKSCLQKNKGVFQKFIKEDDIFKWRRIWEGGLKNADRIIFFSNSSKNIFLKAYPEMEAGKLFVIPHEVKYLKPISSELKKNKINLIVGVLGSITPVKGQNIIQEMLNTIQQEKMSIKIVIIGTTFDYIKNKNLTITGKYDRIQLPELVLQNKIDVFFIPSIWPETFSYTTEEIIQMNLSLAVFDLGAPAERVAKYAKGLIIPKVDAKMALEMIIDFANKS